MSETYIWGIKNGDLDQVKKVVEDKGAGILEDSSSGRMPLHYAADYGQKDIMEYLISRGADVNATDKHGITPILAAIWEGHTSCVKVLLDKGAKKDGQSPDGQSYLECAEKEDIKSLLK